MDKDNNLKYENDEGYAEPPELKKSGVPPLRKQISWFTIGVAILLVIVLALAIYFYLKNR